MDNSLVSFCVYAAEALTAWQYLSAQFSLKRKHWQAISGTALAYGLAWLLFSCETVWRNTLVFIFVNFLLAACFYACSWKSALFHALTLTGLMLASEVVVEFPLGKLLGGFEKYRSSLLVFAVLSAFSKLLYFIFTKICLLLIEGRQEKGADKSPVSLLFGCFSMASIAVIVVEIYTATFVALPAGIENAMLACSFLILFSNILVFAGHQYNQKLSRQYFDLELVLQKEQAEANYFQALQEQYERQRILIHDMRRHLSAIKELAHEGHDASVIEYVEELEATPALQSRIRYCGNPMLNAVLSRYDEICREKAVSFFVDIRDVPMEFLSPSDITALFGNLLENAVEAAQGEERAYLELSVGASPHNGFFISLINSCRVPPRIDGKGNFLTRKPGAEHHGIGLKSIAQTIRKYNGTIQQYYDEAARLFHTSILL